MLRWLGSSSLRGSATPYGMATGCPAGDLEYLLGWPAVVGGLGRFLAAPWLSGVATADTNARLAAIDVLFASGFLLTLAAWGRRARSVPSSGGTGKPARIV